VFLFKKITEIEKKINLLSPSPPFFFKYSATKPKRIENLQLKIDNWN